jgi:hypothetical protein
MLRPVVLPQGRRPRNIQVRAAEAVQVLYRPKYFDDRLDQTLPLRIAHAATRMSSCERYKPKMG